MATNPLLEQIAKLKQSLVDEGIMNEQFVQLDSKTINEEPNFTESSIKIFYEEAKKQIKDLEELMKKILTDYTEVDRLLMKLIGSCASVGAVKAKREVAVAKEFYGQGDLERAKFALEQVKTEIETFKDKLNDYFELVSQAKG